CPSRAPPPARSPRPRPSAPTPAARSRWRSAARKSRPGATWAAATWWPATPSDLIVDAHIHIFPPEVIAERERFLERDRHFGELYANPRARLATAEDALAAMDRNGVAGAVALGFGWDHLALCRMHNDYLISVQQANPGRFAAFAALQPAAGAPALAELARVASAGLRGVGELMPHGQGYRLDEGPIVDPIAEAVAALGLPLLAHVSEPIGHVYAGKGDVSP